MVRVAGLKRRLETGIASHNNVGRRQQVLSDIHAAAYALQIEHARVATDVIRPALEIAGVAITSIDDLLADRKTVDELFVSQIFPVLTPLAVDPAHPFPYISGLSLNLAVRVQNPKSGEEKFARVKVPAILPRFVELPRWTARSDSSPRRPHRPPPWVAFPRHGNSSIITFSGHPKRRPRD